MACEEECPVLVNPCGKGYPAMNSESNPLLCSVAAPSVCPIGYYCHIGTTSETTVCCPGGNFRHTFVLCRKKCTMYGLFIYF